MADCSVQVFLIAGAVSFVCCLVEYVQQVLDFTSSRKHGTLATLMGRYYAMDRDKRQVGGGDGPGNGRGLMKYS